MMKLRTFDYHIIFYLLILLNYSIHYYLFGGFIFTSPTDLLDSEIVFNKILGEIFSGNFSTLNSLLNGEYKWYYFTRIFFITNFIYSFFSTETAFFLLDLIVKSFAYISFFRLSNLIGNKNFYSFLTGITYAYAVTTTTEDLHHSVYGFGASSLPYLTYLILKGKNLNLKNYLIIVFIAINTHFYMAISMFIFPFFLYFYKTNINKKVFVKVFFLYVFFCVLVNSNLLYISIFNEAPLNRDEWFKKSLPLSENLIFIIKNLIHNHLHFPSVKIDNINEIKIFYLPNLLNDMPYSYLYILSIFLLLFKQIEKYKIFIFSIFVILLICFIERTSFFTNFVNNYDVGIIKSISLKRFKILLPFLIIFSLTNIKFNKDLNLLKIKNFASIIMIISFVMFQYNKMIIPYIKSTINYNSLDTNEKNIIKEKFANLEFLNLYKILFHYSNIDKKTETKFLTFKDYYNKSNFLYIKNLVKDNYVLPIDIDPAKLIYNNIQVLGGYFQFYPKSYKDRFRIIIQSELEKDLKKKDYFDAWGFRIYAFVVDPSDVQLNFKQIKLMGASYLLSKKKLSNENLNIICENCNNEKDLNLYNIN